jgi:hypothetical protein
MAASSAFGRWNPSIGTTGTPYVAARAIASVVLPAPGDPESPSTNLPEGRASTRPAISWPSGDTFTALASLRF